VQTAVSVVVNGCENVTANYTINYSIPCNPITFSLQSPASNSATVTSENYQISLNTTNVASQSNVSVLQNGNAIPFTLAGNVVTATNIILQPGLNTITVTLVNDCSSETVSYAITYNAPAPCVAPAISFTSNNATDNSTYTLSAIVSNIDNPSQISVTLNGVPVTASYNTSTDVLGATMTLFNGNNTIAVTANGCEVSSAIFSVNFTPTPPPCNPPVITFTSAATAADATYAFTANVTNVANAAAISVTINGAPVAASFNTTSGILSATITLVDGANSIAVVANGCQVTNAALSVNYDAPVCGTRINPGNSAWEFCLITPGATYTRDNLANDLNFTYSGPATSLIL
jgi:DNA-binding protein